MPGAFTGWCANAHIPAGGSPPKAHPGKGRRPRAFSNTKMRNEARISARLSYVHAAHPPGRRFCFDAFFHSLCARELRGRPFRDHRSRERVRRAAPAPSRALRPRHHRHQHARHQRPRARAVHSQERAPRATRAHHHLDAVVRARPRARPALGADAFLAKPFTVEALRRGGRTSLVRRPRRRAAESGDGATTGDKAREEFFSEAQESSKGLGAIFSRSTRLGARAGRTRLVNDIFRAVHTLKGLAGLFGARA